MDWFIIDWSVMRVAGSSDGNLRRDGAQRKSKSLAGGRGKLGGGTVPAAGPFESTCAGAAGKVGADQFERSGGAGGAGSTQGSELHCLSREAGAGIRSALS